MANQQQYRIDGIVIAQAGQSAAGLQVEVWDWNQGRNDILIDIATTQPDGSFVVDTSRKQLDKLQVDQQPDIFFRVFVAGESSANGDTPVTDTRAQPHKNVDLSSPPRFTIDLPRLANVSPAPVVTPGAAPAPAATPGATPASTPAATPAAPSATPAAPAVSASGSVSYGTISGTLLDAANKPLGGVNVALVDGAGTAQPAQTTGTRGEFSFAMLGPGVWTVQLPAAATGANGERLRLQVASQAAIDVDLEQGEDADLGVIVYEPREGAVRGIVFLAEDDQHTGDVGDQRRLANVRVSLLNLSLTTPPSPATSRGATGARGQSNNHVPQLLHMHTDAQGAFYFADVAPGTYALQFESTLNVPNLGAGTLVLAKAPGSFLVRPGRTVARDVAYLAVGGAIHGTVFFDRDASKHRFGTEPAIGFVPVVLFDGSGKATERSTETDQNGEYRFNVAPGEYTLQFRTTLPFDSNRGSFSDELSLTTAGEVPIAVVGNRIVEAPAAGYQPEVHKIVGRATYEDKQPIQGLVVLLEENGAVVDTAVTNEQGEYEFNNREGVFTLRFPDDPLAGQLLTPGVKVAHVNSVFDAGTTIYRLASGSRRVSAPSTARSGGGGRDELLEIVSDIAAYMPTAQENGGSPARSRSAGSAGTSPSMLGDIIDRELMAVLGGRVKTTADAELDAKSFVASLVRAFPVEEVDGHTIYKHVPRAYAVHTELGGKISGAQASLYRRAKVALDDALPLLDGLKPLDSDADEERTAAVRSIVRTEFVELVNEFGREGGPRVQRVDLLFDQLPGHIDDLEKEFDFDPSEIVTVEDEQIATNFQVIKDYVEGLKATWVAQRKGFADGNTQFLGTQLVLLSRALNSVAESVDEVYQIMDSVYLGSSERQTVRIPLPDENGQSQSILVEDLLNWVARFAAEEGPALVRQGGRPGVTAIRPIAQRLHKIVEAAAEAEVDHVAFSRDRVRRSLRELAAQIGQVERLVDTQT